MKKYIKRYLDTLSDNSKDYYFWSIWILVAVLKTWAVTDLKTGIRLYIK